MGWYQWDMNLADKWIHKHGAVWIFSREWGNESENGLLKGSIAVRKWWVQKKVKSQREIISENPNFIFGYSNLSEVLNLWFS